MSSVGSEAVPQLASEAGQSSVAGQANSTQLPIGMRPGRQRNRNNRTWKKSTSGGEGAAGNEVHVSPRVQGDEPGRNTATRPRPEGDGSSLSERSGSCRAKRIGCYRGRGRGRVPGPTVDRTREWETQASASFRNCRPDSSENNRGAEFEVSGMQLQEDDGVNSPLDLNDEPHDARAARHCGERPSKTGHAASVEKGGRRGRGRTRGRGRRGFGRDVSVPAQTQIEADGEAPTCVVCCEEIQVFAIGTCDHDSVCSTCCLRLRLCYKQNNCPLCKTELKEVIMVPRRSWRQGVTFAGLMAERGARLWQQRRWAPGVLVDRAPTGAQGPPLHVALMQQTARACPDCDPRGRRPLPSDKALLDHVEAAHGRRMCRVCLEAHRCFPLEMQTYRPEELEGHLAAHPACEFCSAAYFDREELYQHMRHSHFTCHVCEAAGSLHQYFDTASHLMAHMRGEHFVCEHPDCEGCMVAFPSREGLHRHNLAAHSGRMPRWDASRARPLQLDLSAYMPQQLQGARGGRGSRGRREPSHPEAGGGMAVVDDDLPPLPLPRRGGRDGAGPSSGSARPPPQGAWASGPSSIREAAEFPSLSEAIAASQREQQEAQQARRPPPLVRRTLRCPCGNRSRTIAATEDEQLPALQCDASCEARLEGERRANQLADAFGVGDRSSYVPYWDRTREPTYTADLVRAGRELPALVQELEAAFAKLLASGQANHRVALRAMPRRHREVAHVLAEQYGLTTQSYGSEPNRYVAVLSGASSGLPSRLLSEVAACSSAAEDACEFDGEIQELELAELEDESYLRNMLRKCVVEFEVVTFYDTSRAKIRFRTPEDMQAAAELLAGGVRGKFRVDSRASAGTCRRQGSSRRPAGLPDSSAGADSDGWHCVRGQGQPPGVSRVQDGIATASLPRPPAVDPWSEGDPGAEAEAATRWDSCPVMDDWEQTAALLSDEAAGASAGEVLQESIAPLEHGNAFEALENEA